MKYDTEPSKKESKKSQITKRGRFFNALLTFFQLTMLLGVAALINTRQGFLEISNSIYGLDAPLMGSSVLDFVMRREWLIVVVALAVAAVVKEFLYPRQSLILNGSLLAISVFINIWLIVSLYP
jgi:hypothetical protein